MNTKAERRLFEEVEERTHQLEKELFKPIDLKPIDIY